MAVEKTELQEDRTNLLQAPATQLVGDEVRRQEEEAVDVTAVEGVLGYRFSDRGLVEEALTHGSYYFPLRQTGVSYERLEFVGDAVLNCLVAREVFSAYANLAPGPLTRLRAVNVDTEKLARVAVGCGLHRFLRHKAPYLEQQIQEFTEDIERYPIHSNGLVDPPKVLADIVESLIGAVFVDSNSSLEVVWKVFRGLAEPLICLDTLGKHPVSELYELCQKNRLTLKFVDAWTEDTRFDVVVNGCLVGSAAYGHKKETAHNRAAKAALDNLKAAAISAGGSSEEEQALIISLGTLSLIDGVSH